jgi:hypothetical protein
VTRTYGGLDYASARCHHPGAPVDPRYPARDELTGVGHSLPDHPDVQDLLLSSLSLPSAAVGGHLAIDPPMAIARVGSEHAVTASLTDPGGRPLFGIVVRFTVTSASSGGPFASGQCVTSAEGTCAVTYTGPAAPDDHTIAAFADGDASGTEDPGEPSATAAAEWREAGGDLAVVKLLAPGAIVLKAGRPSVSLTLKVVIRNRGPAIETIADAAALGQLVHVAVESLGSCPAPTPSLSPGPLKFPAVVRPGKNLILRYGLVIECVNAPARSTRADPGHGDYRLSAAVNRSTLDGRPDAHPADDVCPREPAASAAARDAGCGIEAPDGTWVAPLLDVVAQ